MLRLLIRYAYGAREVWRVVPVPAVDAEAQERHLHRDLETLTQERASTTTRLKGLRSRQGGRLTSLRKVPEPLAALRRWDGAPLPSGLRHRGLRVGVHHEFLSHQMAELDAERRAVLDSAPNTSSEQGQQLRHLKGRGSNGAGVVVRDLFAWRACKHRREVGG